MDNGYQDNQKSHETHIARKARLDNKGRCSPEEEDQ